MEWSKEEISELEYLVNKKHSYDEISIIMGRSILSIANKSKRLRLSYDPTKKTYHITKQCFNKKCEKNLTSYIKSNSKFCSKSCAAQVNNIGVSRNKKHNICNQTQTKKVKIKKQIIRLCTFCGKNKKNGRTKFCSLRCSTDFRYEQKVNAWLCGKHSGYTGKTLQLCNFLRRYLYDTRGTACEECNWDKKHPIDGATMTEIDHIDGDASNNSPENLKILCPNCHSLTPTFRRRNKKSKRDRS